MSTAPTLREERRLLRSGHRYVGGMDEVGRGALAGPVSVGIVVVDLSTRSAPPGVRDSKLLTPAAREALVPALSRWGLARAVGHAQPAEIDALGILGALRLAAVRAFESLAVRPTCLILDGAHDWFTPPRPAQADLLDLLSMPPEADEREGDVPDDEVSPLVVTRIKADRTCAAVAAASVLAKVERDAIMVERSRLHPAYGWQANKGYSAPDHVGALAEFGPCDQHRTSWSLPGLPRAGEAAAAPGPSIDVMTGVLPGVGAPSGG